MNIEGKRLSKNVKDVRSHQTMPLSHFLGEQVPNYDIPREVVVDPDTNEYSSRGIDLNATVEMTPELVRDLQWRGHRTLNDWLDYQHNMKMRDSPYTSAEAPAGQLNEWGQPMRSEKDRAQSRMDFASRAQLPGMVAHNKYWDDVEAGYAAKEEAYMRYIEDKLKRGQAPTEQEIRFAEDLGIYPDTGFYDEGWTLDPRRPELRLGDGRP